MRNIQLSERKISQLATTISDRLFDSHYFHQGVIGGEALKNFCEFEQVNKFLLFQLYQVWQLQITRFKHPYFDFSNPEIEESLTQLQNLLSKNIAISQEDFRPLLKKAVYNNLKLLLDPKAALVHFFFQHKDKISTDLFERYLPFFSDFGFAIVSILRYFQKNNMDQVEKDIFTLKLDKLISLYNAKSDQDIDTYRSLRIYKLTNQHVDDLLKEDQQEQSQLELQQEQEAEAKRKEEERKRREEEAKKREEAAKAEAAKKAEEASRKKRDQSFFDTLASKEEVLLELEESDEEVPVATEPSEKKSTPVEIAAEKDKPTSLLDKINQAQEQTERAATVMDKLGDTEEEEAVDVPSDKNKPETVFSKLADKEEVVEETPDKPGTAKLGDKEEVVEETPDKPGTVFSRLAEKDEPEAVNEPVDKPATIFNKLAEQDEEPAVVETLEDAPAEAKDEKDDAPAVQEISIEIEETPAPEPTEAPVSILDKFKEKLGDKAADTSAAAQAPTGPKTIADRFKSEPAEAPQVDGKPIRPDEIPIHKQYQYVQKVFGGNNVRFRIIVDKINNSKDANEVEEILTKYVFGNSDINKEDATVKEFAALMRSRFS